MREGDNKEPAHPWQRAQLQALDRVMALAEFSLDGRLLHANAN